METPKNRSKRTPTPKLSERKRALFTGCNEPNISEDDDIRPLDGAEAPVHISNKYIIDDCLRRAPMVKIRRNIRLITQTSTRQATVRGNLFDEDGQSSKSDQSSISSRDGTISPSSDKNQRSRIQAVDTPLKKINETPKQAGDIERNSKMLTTPIPKKVNMSFTPARHATCTDELRLLFKDTLNIHDINKSKSLIVSTSEEEFIDTSPQKGATKKRNHVVSGENKTEGPSRKQSKLDINSSETSSGALSSFIPAKSFYSNQPTKSCVSKMTPRLISKAGSSQIPRRKHKTEKKIFNKGVSHKIRRVKWKSLPNVSIEEFLKNIKSAKLKSLPSNRLHLENISEVHKIFKKNQNPIEMARPLNIQAADSTAVSFSDDDCTSDDDEEFRIDSSKMKENSASVSNGISTINEKVEEEPPLNAKKKFFKSGSSSTVVKKFTITNNVMGTISNGKVTILPPKKKRRRVHRSKAQDETFLTEQAKVDNIINSLDVSHDEFINKTPNEAVAKSSEQESQQETTNNSQNLIKLEEHIEFRKRLPYNTSDPEVIERQYLILDFLIAYEICTERNFEIFIANPERYKEEAEQVVNSLVVVVPEVSEEKEISPAAEYYETEVINTDCIMFDDSEIINEGEIESDKNQEDLQSKAESDEETDDMPIDKITPDESIVSKSLIEETEIFDNEDSMEIENINTENIVDTVKDVENKQKYFPIFINPIDYQPIIQKSTRKLKSKFMFGHGLNQYQIDAGQKEFGATQCPQCGLLYTAHEPEEEQLHYNYHNSLHILKFKGWIDEDVVDVHPEWGVSGRVISVSNKSHIKHRERVLDVLKLVDKELGFVTDKIPPVFVAFLAVLKHRIAGFCLTVPIQKANRFIVVNGTDCCTEETFFARCGISRIWVSPLNRRFKIASKLIKAVQSYAIPGQEIDIDEIAFSAPTETGTAFAQKICKRSDFLIYQ